MLETLNKHRSYQANTIVRSFVHLVRMAFRHNPELLDWNLFQKIVSDLQKQYHSFIECGVLM